MFSYFSCFEYLIKLLKKKFPNDCLDNKLELFQNDLVLLCCKSKKDFLNNLFNDNIDSIEFKEKCYKIKKYVLFDEPIQYMTRRVNFYNNEFKVNKGVFIPQVSTETLVSFLIILSEKIWGKNYKLNVLEIGSGSGVIPISLSFHEKNWKFTSVDLNKQAIYISKFNAYRLGIKNIKFLDSNIFSNVIGKFDIIFSNPPYISKDNYRTLDKVVKKQPKNSLIASKNGFSFYYKIISNMSCFLKKRFLVLFEVGINQIDPVKEMINNYFPYAKVEYFKDNSSILRVLAFYIN
jgi:release factor glutamine methyltransferase